MACSTRAPAPRWGGATKTHLTQIVALELLALVLAQARGTRAAGEIASLMDQLLALPDTLEAVLERTKDVPRWPGAHRRPDSSISAAHVGHPVALEKGPQGEGVSYVRA